MAPNDKKKSPTASGGAGEASGSTSDPGDARGSRIYLRFEIPAVLDQALTAYAEAVGLQRTLAARMLLMRLLVQRSIGAPPEPLEPIE